MENKLSKESIKPLIAKYEALTDDIVGIDRSLLLDLLREVSYHRWQEMQQRKKRKEKRLAVGKQ